MGCERQYEEFEGKRGTPLAKQRGLMESAGWTRGVRRVIEEHQMI